MDENSLMPRPTTQNDAGNIFASNSNFTIKEEIIEDIQDNDMEVEMDGPDEGTKQGFQDDGFDRCKVEVNIEDTEYHLEPEFVAVSNEDETLQAMAEKVAELSFFMECQHPYTLFSKEEWFKVQAVNPHYTSQLISKEVWRRWTELDEASKEEYQSRIEAAKARYGLIKENYPAAWERFGSDSARYCPLTTPGKAERAELRSILKCRIPYTLFSKEEWPRVKASYPDFSFKEISKEVGRRWTELDDASKNKYKFRIEAAKVRYSPMMAHKDAKLQSLKGYNHPYIMFSKEEWHKVKAEHPEYAFKDISKEVSKRWGELDEAKKMEYRSRIEDAKARYNQVCEDGENNMVWLEEEPSGVSNLLPETEDNVLGSEHTHQERSLITSIFEDSECRLQDFQLVKPVTQIKIHACEKCDKTFTNKKVLHKHITLAHPKKKAKRIVEIKTYPCKLCDQHFPKKNLLSKHIRLEHPKPAAKSYSCQQCERSFPKKKLLAHHIRMTHPKESFRCKLCDKVIFTQRRLLRHEISHSDYEPEFISVRNLLIPKVYHCEECGKSFKTKRSFAIHNITHLYPKERFSCEDCGKVYPTKSKLNRHLYASHSVQPVACTKCGKKYVKPIFLKRHYKRDHSY